MPAQLPHSVQADSTQKLLTDDSLLIIFTYAPAGLGHLRVTDALHRALPQKVKPLILGAHDTRITWIHRVTSINPNLRKIMEWIQQGTPQKIFTIWYRNWLRTKNKFLYQQLSLLIDQHLEKPDQVTVISTHFGLAHQLAEVKQQLEKDKQIKINLVVQVTDDTPQHIWFVPGADLIIVPSRETKEALNNYRQSQGFKPVKLKVLAYPVSPNLMQDFSSIEFQFKRQQLDPQTNAKINFAIPISGAAVGLNYFKVLVNSLDEIDNSYQFFIISRFSAHTKNFLIDMANKTTTQIFPAKEDHKVVNYYERVYEEDVISLEITKPSEQAFKVLLDPVQRGGAVMLFAKPVGRQEYDNLNFMRRHRLIPSEAIQQELFSLATQNKSIPSDLFELARHWRGVLVPECPIKTAHYVDWLYRNKVFLKMLQYRPVKEVDIKEVNDQGAFLFWKQVSQLIS